MILNLPKTPSPESILGLFVYPPPLHLIDTACLHMPLQNMDTNNLKNKENWLQRQQNMFKNMDGYEGQRAPDECKHTRDQMVHSLHSLVN